MNIIKISPVSFKIILTKEDLSRYGVENILHHTELCGDFFEEIIHKTNAMFDSPFSEGAIDAEFFESKDGGGELFITGAQRTSKNIIYIFSSDDIEKIFSLCQRLDKTGIKPKKSRLFLDDGMYLLLLSYTNEKPFVQSILREYGNSVKADRLSVWVVEEHAKLLSGNDAVGTISGFLKRHTKAKDTPL